MLTLVRFAPEPDTSAVSAIVTNASVVARAVFLRLVSHTTVRTDSLQSEATRG